jgi:hypothetical protein
MEKQEAKDMVIAAIDSAIVSRGKSKGRLKRQCPPMGSDGAAAWQALMLQANPYKASIWQVSLFSERQSYIYRQVSEAIEGLDLRAMDRDRFALELMGAW